MTQAELAEQSGIRQPVLSLYEQGQRTPGADLFVTLVEAMGFDVTFTSRDVHSPMPERLVARVLPELLGLADALPQHPAGELTFPGLPRGAKR